MQPTSLGRYIIEREIGRGAMGRVYLAHDPEIDRRVAIKTIPLPQEQGEEARERFLLEARSVGKLLHPGIVTIFDVGESGNLLYLAMELVEGETFDEFCKPNRLLPVADVCALVANVSDALHYAHTSGVVHRDVKPANLMRIRNSDIKVMDFGLAKPAQANLTTDGALLGTPSYMAPEQIREGVVDGRSDLFSLAVVLFEMLTGEKPFPGDSISSIIYRVVHETPRDVSQLKGRTNPALDAFLQKALAKEPDARFQTGREFSDALRRTVERIQEAQARGEALATPSVPSESPDPSDPMGIHSGPSTTADAGDSRPDPVTVYKPRRSFFWPVLFLLLILVGAGVGGAYAFREELGIDWFDRLFAPPPEPMWEATVRTDPPGLPILLDGVPVEGDIVRFKPAGPFGLLSTSNNCRAAEHRLDAADAGGEIVLFTDPTRLQWTYEPSREGISVSVDGGAAEPAPLELDLNLCDSQRITLTAEGFQPTTVILEPGMTPLEARTALNGATLSATPKGFLTLPKTSVALVYFVDGERIGAGPRELELETGEHKVRAVNVALWIDTLQTLTVEAGGTVAAQPAVPPIGSLTVQAFPPNCKVYLRKPGARRWKFVDDSPMTTRVAAGSYEIRVELKTTGVTKERQVDVQGGSNPPVRFSFARNP